MNKFEKVQLYQLFDTRKYKTALTINHDTSGIIKSEN